jgi:hypothetical protein
VESGGLLLSGGVWRWSGPFKPPARLADMVQARLIALTPQDRATLKILALGEPLDLAVAEAVAGTAGLEAVERHGLLDLFTGGPQVQVRLIHPCMPNSSGRPSHRSGPGQYSVTLPMPSNPRRARRKTTRCAWPPGGWMAAARPTPR